MLTRDLLDIEKSRRPGVEGEFGEVSNDGTVKDDTDTQYSEVYENTCRVKNT